MGIFWSIVTRTGQTAVEASSTLFIGFLVAAVMRRMLGAEGTRRLFGGSGIQGLLRAWVIGSLLPVCSLGVIPVAREMVRAGVPVATVLAFILAAPQLNPLSFLYGLTLSEPLVIICFVVATMILAVSGGELWKWGFQDAGDEPSPEVEPIPSPGLGRLLAVLIAAARDTVGPSLGYALMGIIFTGILAGAIPFGSLSHSMSHDDWRSPLLMTLIGLPSYSGVLPGMMRLGLIFEHGNSVGAAFILFELGVGMNLGLVIWLMVTFGWRRVLLWLTLITVVSLAIAYAIERPLYFAKEEASHTHAFDDWTNPFPTIHDGDGAGALAKIVQKVEILEMVALISLAILGLLGIALQWFDSQRQLDAWLALSRPPSAWDINLPAPVLGVVALVGMVVMSVAALFVYYLPPKEAFEEIVRVRTETITAVRTGHKEEAIRQLERWDLLTRKLQVGVFLRTGSLGADQARVAEDLREELEEVRDALLANDLDEAKRRLPAVEAAYRKVRDLFLAGDSADNKE